MVGLNRKVFLVLAIVIAVFMLVLSLVKPIYIGDSDTAINTGYVLHFVAYALLAGAIYLSNRNQKIYYPLLIAIAYGILMEILQAFTSYRECSAWDAIANSVGALLGVVIASNKNVKGMVKE